MVKQPNPSFFIDGHMRIQFWGIRGTLPVPGRQAIRYGGNTNCVMLTLPTENFFIFDAGTGIKSLATYLTTQNYGPLNAKIFITHPHYDHINGIPFFPPLYIAGNQFEFFGTNHKHMSIKELISNQMNTIYFPVTIKEFASELTFRDLTEETFYIDTICISTMLLNHPGQCLGYRVQYNNKFFCYITDNELYLENSPLYRQQDVERLIRFIRNADVAVLDTAYSDEQYLSKVGWGHSPLSRVIDIADKANVKLLCLHHHNPDETDADIDQKLKVAKSQLRARKSKTKCIAPHEGEVIII